jgi:hypothetical protein
VANSNNIGSVIEIPNVNFKTKLIIFNFVFVVPEEFPGVRVIYKNKEAFSKENFNNSPPRH